MTYDNFIWGIINTRGRFGIQNSPKERHHINPRCIGGDDSELNLIDLYPKEHFIAHKLLVEAYPDNNKLKFAFRAMCNLKNNESGNYDSRYTPTPEGYREDRLKYFNIGLSDEAKLKIRAKRALQVIPDLPTHIQERIDEAGIDNIGKFHRKPETKSNKDTSNYIKEQQRRRELGIQGNFGSKNGMYGNGENVSGGNNGHATIRYFFNDMVFECRKDLVTYLTSEGYNITCSAIRTLVSNNGTFRLYSKYKEVLDNLSLEYKYEN